MRHRICNDNNFVIIYYGIVIVNKYVQHTFARNLRNEKGRATVAGICVIHKHYESLYQQNF